MRGLIFVVRNRGVIDVRDFVEGKRAVEAQVFVSLGRAVAVIAVGGKLLHCFVPRLLMIAIENSPGAAPGDVLQAGINHSQPTTVTKTRMKVSIAPQLWCDPTLFHPLLVTLQFACGEIIAHQRVKDRFCRQHAALDRSVDSLQARAIQEPGAVTDEQHAVCVKLRYRVQASGRDRLRAITNHFAAIQKFGDERMSLESLKLRMRIDQGIAIVETSDVAQVHNPILQSVNPAAPVRPLVGWKAERVRDPTSWITVVGKFPKLFDAETVNLRFASLIQTESLNQLLRQRAAHAFAQYRNLCKQIDAGFEVRFPLSFRINSFVAGAHAQHAITFVIEHLRAGELGEDIDAGLLALLAQPGGQAIE